MDSEEQLAGLSPNVWMRQWDSVYELFGRDAFFTSVVGTVVFTSAVFWLINIFFIVLDVTGKPAVLLRYKVQPDKNRPVSSDSLLRAIRVALFNQTVVGGPFVLCLYKALVWRGCGFEPSSLPSYQRALMEMVVFVAVEEIGFYYFHRLLHHPALYKEIHKLHHEWTAPVGVVAIYAHPIEHVLANLVPAVAGPLLMGAHVAMLWLWLGIVIVTTVIHHSGYHFPFMSSPEFHDFHHLKFNNCYGVLGLLDRLHGTDQLFRASASYHRHKVLFSLYPASKLVPDRCQAGKTF
ncbi:fatty acid hydroxylase domain-containing protein 2-like [Pomacea canaliculata]|uniref:fatty acid hydroxylase domain-containing protein 2-like n=1 Tax=Pomacea canaliculata TaxID=400727 RepID=UPI000D737B01|nr:fatty acid hydroxylase domain-containing protein 2-like [Pomacea canaliculata]